VNSRRRGTAFPLSLEHVSRRPAEIASGVRTGEQVVITPDRKGVEDGVKAEKENANERK
jgi:hypothetical protein